MTKRLSLVALILISVSALAGCGDKHDHHKNHGTNHGDKQTTEKVELKSTQAIDAISIINPYIRATPPGQKNTAMYMQLTNLSNVSHDLVKVESSISKMIELHTHTNDNGVMRMGEVPSIPVPAEETTHAKSGGYHVMIMDLEKDLKLGDKFDFTLTFKDGTKQFINAEVKEASVEDEGHDAHKHHH